MFKKGLAPIFLILIIAAAIAATAGLLYYEQAHRNLGLGQIACTQEAKICPDGSAVGRTGPNCEFARCPVAATSTPAIDTSGWNTYSSNEFGFSFKYPAAWQKSADVLTAANPHIFFGNPLSGLMTYSVKISIEYNPQNFSAADYAKQMLASDQAEAASNSKSSPAPQITPQFEKQYPIRIGDYAGYELFGVFEFDHHGEQIYVQQNKQMLVFDFPVPDPNPNLSDPVANNAVAHQMVNSLKLDPNIWKFCGGIAGFQCAAGYSCKLDGAYPDAGGHCVLPDGMGTLTGKVTIGPNCPVEKAGVPCPPPPGAYVSRQFDIKTDNNGQIVKTFNADETGNYIVSLPPGTYTIASLKTGIGYMSKDLPANVTIKAGETATLNIDIDTGIR